LLFSQLESLKGKTLGTTKTRSKKPFQQTMMTIIKTIVVATCLLFSSALTQGATMGQLRVEKSMDITNARRLQKLTMTRLTVTDTDLQSAFRELLGYSSNQWGSSMSMSMSMRYNAPTASPVASPTTMVRSASPTTAPPSMRSPTAAPVENPTTRVIPIKTDPTTKPNQQTTQQYASRRRLSKGAIAGIAIVASAVVIVSAAMFKNRLAPAAL
jgi:hypothetical protein